jgi:sugar/nucleoside kinase (ribokinase family)
MQVGTDANAELLRGALRHAGVRLDHLRQVEGPTGTAIILLQPSGGPRAVPLCPCLKVSESPLGVVHLTGADASRCRGEQHHHRGRRQHGRMGL